MGTGSHKQQTSRTEMSPAKAETLDPEEEWKLPTGRRLRFYLTNRQMHMVCLLVCYFCFQCCGQNPGPHLLGQGSPPATENGKGYSSFTPCFRQTKEIRVSEHFSFPNFLEIQSDWGVGFLNLCTLILSHDLWE